MRIMLGAENQPSLLVDVEKDFNRNDFKFYVVNGAWYGHFNNGYISVFGSPGGDFSSLDKIEIIADNQDRLRGDYNDVFEHFSDESYIAPSPKIYAHSDEYDDDIPF